MIIIPVVDQRERNMIMIFVTPDAIERLQAGQRCDLHVPALERMPNVSGVVLRFVADDIAAAAAAQQLAPGVDLSFQIVMRDVPSRPT